MTKPPRISFARVSPPSKGTLVLLAAEGAQLGSVAGDLDFRGGGFITRAAGLRDFKGKPKTSLDLIAPSELGELRVLVAGIGDAGELKENDWLTLGGRIRGMIGDNGAKEATVIVEHETFAVEDSVDESAALLALGLKLRSYKFDKYKTKTNGEKNGKKTELSRIAIQCANPARARRRFAPLKAVGDGVILARDLVNEPPNVLHPEEFARRAGRLEKIGLEIEILKEKEMKKLGMRALLGVGQGSVHPSRLVVMRWNGARKKDAKPLAFIGKGVCFDTGGISIKPSPGMGDMKGDMGGAACVTGLMHALAARKAKVNAIGVIGLVENMPDGKAQRPGDIVASMSGQTIEILNTDAEGRLVLADALWYTQDRFKPAFMIDLATLTGAILISLGQEYAGLFSNNDELAERLTQTGLATGEKIWRMPLGPEYDKQIDTKIADMKNIGGRNAGSITAAQFLQRFVNDVPWVHLDVAGTAMNSKSNDINQSWGSGWGVRLLDRLVAEHYE